MNSNEVIKVWDDRKAYFANSSSIVRPAISDDIIASMFSPGPYYYYIFNFGTLQFDYFSTHVTDILGLEPDKITLESFMGCIHPDDMEHMATFERMAAKFLLEDLSPDLTPKYKVCYCYRIQLKSGASALFLHQGGRRRTDV